MATSGIQLIDTFLYSGKRFLDLRQSCATLEELMATPETSIPDGFTKFCEETQCWYEWNSHNDTDADTGKWRKTTPIYEMLSEEYVFAITDKDGALLFGIREDGEVVYNRGMSDEARVRFDELKGIQPMSNENFIYAITDASGRVLFGISHTGEVVYDKGIPEEVKPMLRRLNRDLTDARERIGKAERAITDIKERLSELDGYRLMEDENFIFAIMDENEEHLLFGIDRTGRVVFDKGVPGEVEQRFDELKGYQIMHDENYLFALTDNLGNLLFGIETTGHAVVPKGIVEIVSWERYKATAPHANTLYVIEGKDGRIEGAYLNGRALSAGEEYAFMREGNVLMYHGRMTSLPRIWLDEETMQLMIEYPSDYTGPLFIVEDGMLFII